MKLRFALPFVLPVAACASGGLSASIPVNISTDTSSPVTCLVHVTPVNPADAPDITGWDVFVPTRNAITPNYKPVSLRVLQFSASKVAYTILWLRPDGTIDGDGPAREALQGKYGKFDSPEICPRAG